MMGILWTIAIGFVVGLVARALKPGDDKAGFLMTTLIGVGGALLATYGGQAVGIYAAGQPAGFIGAVVGAVAVLFVVSRLQRA